MSIPFGFFLRGMIGPDPFPRFFLAAEGGTSTPGAIEGPVAGTATADVFGSCMLSLTSFVSQVVPLRADMVCRSK